MQWRRIQGEEWYEVSDEGHVRSIDRLIFKPDRWGLPRDFKWSGRVLKSFVAGAGYRAVVFTLKGRKRYVHRLVADAFCPRGDGQTQVNHLDGDKANNRASNLEWVTQSANMKHASHVLGRRGGQFGPDRVRHGAGAHA